MWKDNSYVKIKSIISKQILFKFENRKKKKFPVLVTQFKLEIA